MTQQHLSGLMLVILAYGLAAASAGLISGEAFTALTCLAAYVLPHFDQSK